MDTQRTDGRSMRGFASMNKEKQREIARKGGSAAHEKRGRPTNLIRARPRKPPGKGTRGETGPGVSLRLKKRASPDEKGEWR